MLDIDQIRISVVGIYLRWDNIGKARDAYTNRGESHNQHEINFSGGAAAIENLKAIASFLSLEFSF